MSSNPCLIKRLVPQFVESSTMAASYLQLTPEQQGDQLWYKRTAKKFITSHQTFTAVALVLLPILNSWIFSSHQILNYKDWTAADKLESAHLSCPLPKCSTSIRDIWALISSLEVMTCSVHTCAWSVLRESTFIG